MKNIWKWKLTGNKRKNIKKNSRKQKKVVVIQ